MLIKTEILPLPVLTCISIFIHMLDSHDLGINLM